MVEILNEKESEPKATHCVTIASFLNTINEHADSILKEDCSFIFINVSSFKTFNQNYGFAQGDLFLDFLTDKIHDAFPTDLLGRVSGDRFLLYVKTIDTDKIKSSIGKIQEDILGYKSTIPLHINCGIYINDKKDKKPTQMIDCAKLACDYIEDNLGDYVMIYSESIEQELDFKHYIITGFDQAVKNHYIQPYFQCEVRSLTRKICGYEALARWIDPTYGFVSPGVFVPILENARLIHKLDLCIIDQVCQVQRAAIDNGFPVQPISVNLSRLDFLLCDIFTEVDSLRKKHKVPIKLINIEVTEGAFAQANTPLETGVENFRKAGYQIWMDDFGSGFSSLNNLQAYQFDVIKIDRMFLKDMNENPRSRIILASVINMAKTLKMHTLAEGIETEEEFNFLRFIGCEKIQGFLFGKPKPCDPDVQMDDNCEASDIHNYYDKMGEVNVISPSPFDTSMTRIFSEEAIAICEIEGERNLSYIFYNDTFKDLLAHLNIHSKEQAQDRAKESGMRENDMFFELAKKAENTGKIESTDLIINGAIINERLKFLARSGDKATFLLSSTNLSSQKSIQQAQNIQASMRHMLTLYFRIDLYDEDGSVENIYLNSSQNRITDESTDAVEAVSMYADNYLPEDERDNFKNYYDITTVQSRLKENNVEYLVGFYHSIVPEFEDRTQIYILLPFKINQRQKYLSLARNMQYPPDYEKHF